MSGGRREWAARGSKKRVDKGAVRGMSVVLTYEAVSVDSQKYVLLPLIKNSFGNVQSSSEYVE